MNTQRHTYTISIEPRGVAYDALISHAAHECSRFLIVVRPGMSLDESARAVIRDLEPHLVSRQMASEWPGTKLLESTAEVSTYATTAAAVSTLRSATDRLFAWTQPKLPEDLCFLDADGTAWLATISHEKDAFLSLTDQGRRALTRQCPDIAKFLVHEHEPGETHG